MFFVLFVFLGCPVQELGKTWEEVQSEDDRDLVEDEDE